MLMDKHIKDRPEGSLAFLASTDEEVLRAVKLIMDGTFSARAPREPGTVAPPPLAVYVDRGAPLKVISYSGWIPGFGCNNTMKVFARSLPLVRTTGDIAEFVSFVVESNLPRFQ